MNKFSAYFRVCLLKALKLYPIIISFTVILSLGVGTVFGNILLKRSESEENTKFQIGLVGNTSDSYLGIGVFAVRNFDISKNYVEFLEMTEDEALDKLEKHEIVGYVSIPDGFIDSVVSGENIDIKYITNASPAMLGALFVEEICSVVSEIVISSQSGINGYIEFLDGIPKEERMSLIDKINVEYITHVFDRESAYQIVDLGYAENLSFELYYICAIVVVLLLLWGICCCSMFNKKSMSLSRVQTFAGRGAILQILSEYLAFVMVIFSNVLLVFCIIGIFVENKLLDISFVTQIDTTLGIIGLGISMLPAIFLICSVQFLFYELSGSIIASITLQVFSILALSFISGFILPIYSLPEIIRNISGFLPTVVCFEYIKSLLTDSFNIYTLTETVMFAVAFVFVSVVVRHVKVRSERYA